MFAGKSALMGALAKCKNAFDNTDDYKALQELLETVKNATPVTSTSTNGAPGARGVVEEEDCSLVRSS